MRLPESKAGKLVYPSESGDNNIYIDPFSIEDKLKMRTRPLASHLLAITATSWGRADWMTEKFGSQGAQDVAQQTFDFLDEKKVSRVARKLTASIIGGADTYLFAYTPGQLQPVGFARTRSDVSYTDNLPKRAVKRTADFARSCQLVEPDSTYGLIVNDMARVYGAITDVNVAHAHQGERIGLALTDAALRNQQPDRKVTTYIEEANTRLQAKLADFGFKADGAQARYDIFDDQTPFNEVRYVSTGRVSDVLHTLHEQYPFLAKANPAYIPQ